MRTLISVLALTAATLVAVPVLATDKPAETVEALEQLHQNLRDQSQQVSAAIHAEVVADSRTSALAAIQQWLNVGTADTTSIARR